MNTKNIVMAVLAILVAIAVWKWYHTHSYLQTQMAQYKLVQDSLDKLSFSGEDHRIYMDSTGGSTTTVVALDKANNSGIGGVTVTIKKLVGTTWTQISQGTTDVRGNYSLGASLGSLSSYRIRCVNGTKDDQTQQYTNTSLGTVTFFLKN